MCDVISRVVIGRDPFNVRQLQHYMYSIDRTDQHRARIQARYAASECAVVVKSSSENMTVIPAIKSNMLR